MSLNVASRLCRSVPLRDATLHDATGAACRRGDVAGVPTGERRQEGGLNPGSSGAETKRMTMRTGVFLPVGYDSIGAVS